MKIWELSDHEKTIEFIMKNQEDSRKLPDSPGSHGISQLASWTALEIKTSKKGTKQDFTQILKGMPVFIGRTLEVLDPLIHTNVEYLPLLHDDLNVNIVNVISVIDCLDTRRSIARRYKDGGLINYTKIVFIHDLLKDTPNIFKIPERTTQVFVSDKFRTTVLEAKLKGFEFTEIWDSETTEEMDLAQKQKYNNMLTAIEKTKGPRFSYGEAVNMTEAGKAVAHKQWKLQADKKGSMLIGTLGEDCKYHWIDPIYIPPIFLEIQWHEVDKSDI